MKKTKINDLIQLFFTFAKIGAFTFGGGYAMIALIRAETCERRAWVNDDDILEITAIAESTPGPIAINAATFIGHRKAGFSGAFFATVGMVLPSFLIILAIAAALSNFSSLRVVKYAFLGIRAGVVALMLHSLAAMYRNIPKKLFSHGVMFLSFALCAFFSVNVLFIIASCALFGLFQSIAASKKERNGHKGE